MERFTVNGPLLCCLSDTDHLLTPEHIAGLADYLLRSWGLVGARRLIARYGVEDVAALVLEIDEGLKSDGQVIRNPAGLLVWSLRALDESRMR